MLNRRRWRRPNPQCDLLIDELGIRMGLRLNWFLLGFILQYIIKQIKTHIIPQYCTRKL